MKKIISSVIAGVMLSANVSALAETAPSLDFLKASIYDPNYTYTSYDSNISFKLNEKFAMVNQLQNIIRDGVNFLDLDLLFETIFDSAMTVNVKQVSENEGVKAELNAKFNTPIKFNKNLEVSVNQNYNMWVDLPAAKDDKVDFNIIYETPFDKRYITIDSESIAQAEEYEAKINKNIIGENGEAITLPNTSESMENLLAKLLKEENLDVINEKAIESIYKNAEISGNNDHVSIVFSDIGLKKYFADIMQIAMEYYDDDTKALVEKTIESSGIERIAKNVPFFDTKALILEYKLDSKGRIKESDAQINVKLNVYDLICEIAGNCPGQNQKDSVLNFSVNAKSRYNYDKINADLPVLTEENSISFYDMMPKYDNDYDESFNYCYWVYSDGGVKRDDEQKIIIPLRSMLEECSYEVTYDNGTITASTDYKYAPAASLEFKVGSAEVKINGNNIEKLNVPVKIIDDSAYVRAEDIADILNMEFESYTYYILDNSCEYYFYNNADISDFEATEH